jgi:hypothetical protein
MSNLHGASPMKNDESAARSRSGEETRDAEEIARIRYAAETCDAAGRDENGPTPEWFRAGFLAEEVAPRLRQYADLLAASVPNTGTALSEEEQATIDKARVWLGGDFRGHVPRLDELLAIIDRLSSAPSRGSDSKEPDDTQRLDWMQNRVDGTGEAMQFGGVCYWGVEIVKGPRSKPKRIGEGDDLRDAIDDAIANEAARLIATAPAAPLVPESAGGQKP